MPTDEVRPMMGTRHIPEKSAPAKGHDLSGDPQQAHVLLQVDGDRSALRKLEQQLIVLKRYPCDLELCWRHPDHLLSNLDGRTRRIALEHHSMGTPTQEGQENQSVKSRCHCGCIVARPMVG